MKLIIRRMAVAVAVTPAIVAVAPAQTAQAAVRSCSISTAVASRPTLVYGDTGSCVKLAQTYLLNKGYSLGGYGATGSFYSYTKAAVLAFQKNNGLVQNGTVDYPTWKKLSPYSIAYGPNLTKRIVLTYDDCTLSLSAMQVMVRHAKAINVGLVLAPTGNCVSSGRFSASYARAYGQYVINHSVSHPDLTTLSWNSLLYQLGSPGIVTNFGRPPYGAYNTTVLKGYAAKGMKAWTWNVDTNDWRGKTTAQVVSYVNTYAYAGSTVLMHMQHSGFTPAALDQMKAGLAKRGLSLCPAYPGTTPVKLSASIC